jgi:two-component system nitrate/nitrite sensor histidine kinase NarX
MTDATERMVAYQTLEQRVVERTREIERRRKVAEGLRDILTILNSNRPLDEILDYIVAQAGRLLGTEVVAIYRRQGKDGPLSIQAAQGLSADYVDNVKIAVGQGAVGQAVLKRRPVAVPDVAAVSPNDDAMFPEPQQQALLARLADRYRARLAVPLIVRDEVYGGIELYYPEPTEFSTEEIELAVSFSDQAALAIENARLRAQAEQSAVAAERSRLARDLHDAVTQSLYSASLIAEVLPRLWERNPDQVQLSLEDLRRLTRGALAEMRTLLLELRPAALTKVSLGDLLRQLAEAIATRIGVPVTLTVERECALPSEVRVALYRIAQEALNNVAKHSGANQVTVSLCCSPPLPPAPAEGMKGGEVELLVSENGRGFNLQDISPKRLGLGIMHERAEAIGATLKIESQIGHGTQVVAVWSDT